MIKSMNLRKKWIKHGEVYKRLIEILIYFSHTKLHIYYVLYILIQFANFLNVSHM